MQPPTATRWIDQHWEAIGEILPTFTMDWLYEEYGTDRLKHHLWMLTRPSFQTAAQDLHRTLMAHGDVVIRSVTESPSFDFPDGTQRTLALRFFRHLQKPDGEEATAFLVATACELVGATPLCAYQEAELRQWAVAAIDEEVPHYGNVYNLMINVIAQTILWVLGCLPYTRLQLKITPSSSVNRISVWIDEDPWDGERLLLQRYCLTLNEQLQRLGRRSAVPRTYHEGETH